MVAVAVIAVAVLAGLAVTAAAGLGEQRAQARAGADLAALAAAYAVRAQREGDTPDPCAIARTTAEANGVALTACALLGDGSVQVTTASGRANAHARAGPSGAQN